MLASLVFLLSPIPAAAIEIDACTEQRNDIVAEKYCKQLILSGHSDANVYIRLIEALRGMGKFTEASSVSGTALSQYGTNKNLQDLERLNRSNIAEEIYSTEKNKSKSEANSSSGIQKVLLQLCLYSGKENALDKCLQHQSLVGPNKQVSKRIYLLLKKNQFNAPAGQNATTAPVDNASKVQNQIDGERRKLVTNIQNSLREFGIDVGIPDGLAGRKTKTGIQAFYKKTDWPPHDISQALGRDLTKAIAAQQLAMQLHKSALLLQQDEQFEDAIVLFAKAKSAAPWFQQQGNLLRKIDGTATISISDAAKQEPAKVDIRPSAVLDAPSPVAILDEEIKKLKLELERDSDSFKLYVKNLNQTINKLFIE